MRTDTHTVGAIQERTRGPVLGALLAGVVAVCLAVFGVLADRAIFVPPGSADVRVSTASGAPDPLTLPGLPARGTDRGRPDSSSPADSPGSEVVDRLLVASAPDGGGDTGGNTEPPAEDGEPPGEDGEPPSEDGEPPGEVDLPSPEEPQPVAVVDDDFSKKNADKKKPKPPHDKKRDKDSKRPDAIPAAVSSHGNDEGADKKDDGSKKDDKADDGEAKQDDGEAKQDDDKAADDEAKQDQDDGEAKQDDGSKKDDKADDDEAKQDDGDDKKDDDEAKQDDDKADDGEAKQDDGDDKKES